MSDREKVINDQQREIEELEERLAIVLEGQPEIVRCKDCVFWQDNNDGYPHKDCKWREDETPDPDDYCSAGEHKKGS